MVPDIASQQPPGTGRPVPPPPAAPSNREDLRAVMAARRDLGPDYEDALVDSFLDKLDVEIAARVRNEVAAHLARQPPGNQPKQKDSAVGIAIGSLALGIPLTGIAVGNAHLPGLLLAWGGIVAVNLAYALGRRRER
ncbi:hypothetical protein SAMN05421833_111185 [Microbispora rosea]|uniref:Integral membrane protein n=1 Tax=Microbispora rosea TaxID=58117 RepID=A0A1N7CBX9_9ACTN|nr:hypothetical protein Mro03_35650 [Microbispora rosea subsp. rosea]SIR61151.1 hypothetical protein SAMN05421833_111185 [Microbispora rosea]